MTGHDLCEAIRSMQGTLNRIGDVYGILPEYTAKWQMLLDEAISTLRESVLEMAIAVGPTDQDPPGSKEFCDPKDDNKVAVAVAKEFSQDPPSIR